MIRRPLALALLFGLAAASGVVAQSPSEEP